MSLASVETSQRKHTSSEFQNLWTCQKLIRMWTDHPEWNSYDMIPVLYRALHIGKGNISNGKGEFSLAQSVRTTEAHIQGFPSNLLPDPQRAYLLIAQYSDELDRILRERPKTMEKTIRDAAFSYYVFERIHPFPDGNGRVGRMIAKTVLKAGNLKDPVFHDSRWYGGERSTHLHALEQVGETNSLTPLELFLARSLAGGYKTYGRDFIRSRDLTRIIEAREREARRRSSGSLLRDIWSGFGDLPLYGNQPVLKRQRTTA